MMDDQTKLKIYNFILIFYCIVLGLGLIWYSVFSNNFNVFTFVLMISGLTFFVSLIKTSNLGIKFFAVIVVPAIILTCLAISYFWDYIGIYFLFFAFVIAIPLFSLAGRYRIISNGKKSFKSIAMSKEELVIFYKLHPIGYAFFGIIMIPTYLFLVYLVSLDLWNSHIVNWSLFFIQIAIILCLIIFLGGIRPFLGSVAHFFHMEFNEQPSKNRFRKN